MDDSLQAYNDGHQDGASRRRDPQRADDPRTGPDYRVGVVDGSVVAFQAELVGEVRRILGEIQ